MNDKKKKMLKKGCPIADRTDEVVHYVQEREVSNIRYPSQTARLRVEPDAAHCATPLPDTWKMGTAGWVIKHGRAS
jgi:hypothetical protein